MNYYLLRIKPRLTFAFQRFSLLVCGLIITLASANAQLVNTYGFTTLSGTYSSITGGTTLGTATNDDTSFPNLPIGFNFVYHGVNFTNFGAQSNGFIALGTTLSSSYTAISTGTSNNVIAAFNQDLQGNTTTGQLNYVTQGTAPNRILTVEWLSYRHYGTTGDDYNFQIKLYETTNVIEIIYGTVTQNATSRTNQVGLRGASNADFNNRTTTTDWSATTAGGANNATCASTSTVVPASGTTFRFTPPNPAAPSIFETATVPNCSNGAEVDITGGTPPTNVAWYWQTMANGTSTADIYTGPKFYLVNGYVYARAKDTVLNAWSFETDSLEITTVPTATTPPAPTADQNPACSTTGTNINMPAAPVGTTYYWQGTDNLSLSMANDAATPYAVATSGTYIVRAFETSTGCWSDTAGIAVVINSIIPSAPIVTDSILFACENAPSIMATAQDGVIPGSLLTTTAGGNGCGGGAMFDITALSSNVTVTGLDIIPGSTTITTALVYIKTGSYIGSETNAGDWTLVGSYPFTPTTGQPSFIDIDDFMVPAGQQYGVFVNYYAQYTTGSSVYSNSDIQVTTGAGLCSAFGGVNAGRMFNGTVYYDAGVDGDINWYDASTGGNLLGSGTPFELVGTSVIPTATNGIYEVYAGANYLGCNSVGTTLVTVNVNPVNVTIDPIDVSCNNAENGSFVISNVDCGTAPFSFSVNSGTFGPAPTNLAPGIYTVIVQDAGSFQSAEYTIEILDALAPSDVVVNTFNNDEVDLSWISNGLETSWNIEWGATGFTPGTGTQIGSATASDTNYLVTGLDGNTDYDFYISANCGGATVTGQWVLISQTTLCDALLAQGFCESFDSDSQTQACWSVLNANTDGDSWDMDYSTNPFSGDQTAMMYTDFNAGNNDDWLITPGMVLTANEIMSFHYRVQSAGEPNDFEVLLSTTGTNPADFTDTLMALNSYSNIVYADTSLNLSAFSGTCYIAFHVPSGGLDGWRLYIDQVCIDICTPAPGIDGATDVCRLDANLDLNTVITQGESNGVWNFAPNTAALNGSDLNVTAIPDGTFEAQYIVTTACTIDTTVATFTVFPASSAGIDGQMNVCKNQPINLIAGLNGLVDHGGTWYNPSNVALSTGQISSGNLPGQFNYNYVTSNGVCPNDTSNVIVNVSSTCDWTGLEELNTSAITVYPNPTSGMIYIANTDPSQNFYYEVTDVNGRVVNNKANEVNGTATVEINLTTVEHGIYMVRVFNDAGTHVFRVVKQ